MKRWSREEKKWGEESKGVQRSAETKGLCSFSLHTVLNFTPPLAWTGTLTANYALLHHFSCACFNVSGHAVSWASSPCCVCTLFLFVFSLHVNSHFFDNTLLEILPQAVEYKAVPCELVQVVNSSYVSILHMTCLILHNHLPNAPFQVGLYKSFIYQIS